jgi:hypothetical protein
LVHGPHAPRSSTPDRVPGSLRRTTTVDSFRPDGFGAHVHMIGRARDLFTDREGRAHVVATAGVDARAESMDRNLVSIDSDPVEPALRQLVGAMVGPGFRRRVDEAVPDRRDTGDLLYLLLDDMPGAALVAGTRA